jgi:predicted dehydrogenase
MPVRLLILGTGGMARGHADAFVAIEEVEILAAVDTDPHRLADFCKTYGVSKSFTNLDEAIEWGRFDAATNVTPDAVHYATTMALLAAGKHVLCEKPLALSYPQATAMAEAAKAAGVVNMINLT